MYITNSSCSFFINLVHKLDMWVGDLGFNPTTKSPQDVGDTFEFFLSGSGNNIATIITKLIWTVEEGELFTLFFLKGHFNF